MAPLAYALMLVRSKSSVFGSSTAGRSFSFICRNSVCLRPRHRTSGLPHTSLDTFLSLCLLVDRTYRYRATNTFESNVPVLALRSITLPLDDRVSSISFPPPCFP
ncbi:hypothetical protein FRC18_006592 [Serendipita sp. 400]|nr:hypothetical protein FRC18_006592 [Serendipita sp. 400]